MIHRKPAKSVRLIVASLAISCTLPIASAKPAATKESLAAKTSPSKISQRREAARTQTDIKPKAIRLKKPPIFVRAVSNLGYIVSFDQPYSQQRGQPYLLSIGGVNLRDKAPQEVKRLLQGPPGSTLRIAVLHEDGKTEDIDLIIPTHQKTNGMFSPEEFYGAIERFNTEEIHPRILEQDKTNNDLLAKGYCNDSTKRCSETQESETNTLSRIFQALAASQAIGDYAAADCYLQQALTALTENSGKLRTLQFNLANTIKNLVALGKLKEATLICQKLASPQYQSTGEHIDPFKILECLAMIDTAESREAQAELIERLYPIYSAEQTANNENLLWFGQLLEARDKTAERALQIYSAQTKTLRDDRDSVLSFVSFQKLAECLYLKAQAQSKLGLYWEARNTLNPLDYYSKYKLPANQLALLDQLPLYFPKPSDIAAAEEALKQSKTIPPLPPLTCQPWYESCPKGKTDENYAEISLQFPTAKACFEAIKNGDKKSAINLAQQLLKAYENEASDEDKPSRQNLFCTNMRIARALADKGWTSDSEHVLKELANIIQDKNLDPGLLKTTASMIEAEHLVNLVSGQHIDKKISNKAWQSFENNYLEIKTVGDSAETKRISYTFEKCKRLRLLAMNYSFADEYKRAKLFFDRALQIEPAIIADEEALRYIDKQLDERFLLRINLAMLFAKEGDYGNADKYIKLAQEQQPEANQTIIGSLIKTAEIFNQTGQTDRSIDLLRKILASKLVDQYCSVDQLKMKLAALLFKKGVNSEANKLIGLSNSTLSSALLASNYGRAAEIAEKAGNYREAAKYYRLAGQSFSTEDTKAAALFFLQKAIACAEQSKDLDNDTLATYYLGLADRGGYQDSSSFSLREKALTLMSDSNPKKPEVIRYTTYLRREARREALSPARKKEMLSSESGDDRLRIVYLLKPTADELESDLQAANLAEKNRLPDRGDYWMALAMAEAQAEKPDDALVHARRSIAAYTKNDPRATGREQIVGNSGISTFLAVNCARDQGKTIFEEAIKRVQDVQGPSSIAAQVQMAHYFDFCVNEQFRKEAVEILDELLATDLNQGRFVAPDPNYSVCSWGGPTPIESSFEAISIINATLLDCFKRRDTDLGIIAAKRLLAAERKQFPAGDFRTATGTALLARGLTQWVDLAKAETLFREAKPILEKHGSWDNETDTIFRKLLKEVGKQDEVDKMDEVALKERTEAIKRDEARNR
jgi:hypothetical protein